VHQLTHIDLLDLQPRLKHKKDAQGVAWVFDPVRRKYIRTNPEEIVRQLWILYFIETLSLNPKLIAVERAFTFNGMKRRFDLVIFTASTTPYLLAEFKSPGIRLHQDVFDQIAQYNMQLHVPFALVSNGGQHYCFQIDDEKKGFVFQQELPF
jgi:hypothetical protein